MTADEALTEIQRVVTRAVARGDNSSYIDEISELITDELMENPEKLFTPKAVKPKIVIMNSQYTEDNSITMIMPLAAAKEIHRVLETPNAYNLTVAEKLQEAIEVTEMGHTYIGFIEKQGN